MIIESNESLFKKNTIAYVLMGLIAIDTAQKNKQYVF